MIDIGEAVPRRKGRVLRMMMRALMRATRWQITGRIPDVKKFVLIAGPHTSNWDFFVGMMTLLSLGIEVHWIGKHTIFRGPVGGLLRRFGGIPVNRRQPGVLLRDILLRFENEDQFVFALAPEGTRKKVQHWKPGFHRIARMAEVPILPSGIDFARKTVDFGALFFPTEDVEHDIQTLREYFEVFTPKNPEQYQDLLTQSESTR